LCKIFHPTGKKKKKKKERERREHGEVGEKKIMGLEKKKSEVGEKHHHAGERERLIMQERERQRRGREGESTEKWGRKIIGLGKKSSVFVIGNLCTIFSL
jgi:hypothetical protein